MDTARNTPHPHTNVIQPNYFFPGGAFDQRVQCMSIWPPVNVYLTNARKTIVELHMLINQLSQVKSKYFTEIKISRACTRAFKKHERRNPRVSTANNTLTEFAITQTEVLHPLREACTDLPIEKPCTTYIVAGAVVRTDLFHSSGAFSVPVWIWADVDIPKKQPVNHTLLYTTGVGSPDQLQGLGHEKICRVGCSAGGDSVPPHSPNSVCFCRGSHVEGLTPQRLTKSPRGWPEAYRLSQSALFAALPLRLPAVYLATYNSLGDPQLKKSVSIAARATLHFTI